MVKERSTYFNWNLICGMYLYNHDRHDKTFTSEGTFKDDSCNVLSSWVYKASENKQPTKQLFNNCNIFIPR